MQAWVGVVLNNLGIQWIPLGQNGDTSLFPVFWLLAFRQKVAHPIHPIAADDGGNVFISSSENWKRRYILSLDLTKTTNAVVDLIILD